MAHDEADEPPAAAADDALRRLTDRLEQASDAAERLFTQATEEAATRIGGSAKPPPRGWQQPDDGAGAPPPSTDVLVLLQSLGGVIPVDLQRRLAEAIRELLLAFRALIDWSLELVEQRRAKPVQVQDIPVL